MITEEVSRPYQLIFDPAICLIAYFALSMNSSSSDSSVFAETDLHIMQNLKVPTVDLP